MAIRNNMNLGVRNIVLDLKRLGKTCGQISKILGEVYGYSVTRFGIYKFLQRTKNGNERKPRAGKFTEGHKMVLNLRMSQNSDWTARDIQKMFQKELDVSFSLATIKRQRFQLKWTAKQKKDCQLISAKNRRFRVTWCLEKLCTKDTFLNVVFVDESNVELSASGRLSFYQSGSTLDRLPHKVAKPKHSYTVSTIQTVEYESFDCAPSILGQNFPCTTSNLSIL